MSSLPHGATFSPASPIVTVPAIRLCLCHRFGSFLPELQQRLLGEPLTAVQSGTHLRHVQPLIEQPFGFLPLLLHHDPRSGPWNLRHRNGRSLSPGDTAVLMWEHTMCI